MYQYTIRSVVADPTNSNIVATVDFQDTSSISNPVYTRQVWGFDLTNAQIDAWAYNVIQTLVTRDQNIAEITTGTPTTPATPVVDPTIAAKQTLAAAIADAEQAALVAQFNSDPSVISAAQALTALQSVATPLQTSPVS
jgi:hypothetical protein